MKFSTKLEKLRNIKNQCLFEIESLEEQKENELKTTKTQILEKYSKLSKSKYQELEQHNNSIDSYCQIVEDYSFFNIDEIGNIIASLIRTFEGKNYVYQDSVCFHEEVKILYYAKEVTIAKDSIRMVVAKENEANFYTDNDINLLVKNKKVIILSTSDTPKDDIQFYRVNTGNHSIEQCVRFGRFNYVKEFIDALISYKIDNKQDSISYEELEDIKIDFIASHIKQIEENYRVLREREEHQMTQKLLEDNDNCELQLRRILNK